MSITAALIIPCGIAFLAGLYAGLIIGSALLSLSFYYPVPVEMIANLSLFAASVSAPVGWVWGLRWWYRSERQYYYDQYDERRGYTGQMTMPQTRPYTRGTLTDGFNSPADYNQTRDIAQMVVKAGKWSVTVRSLRRWLGDDASAYILWLVGEGYADYRNPENSNAGVYITDEGMGYFRDKATGMYVKPHSYSPTGDGWIPFN